jgi:hypothetical protein
MKLDYRRGDVVQVTMAYQGNNRFAPDGHEGVYTVVAPMLSGADFKLCRGGTYAETPDPHEWDLMCHVSRMEPVEQ